VEQCCGAEIGCDGECEKRGEEEACPAATECGGAGTGYTLLVGKFFGEEFDAGRWFWRGRGILID